MENLCFIKIVNLLLINYNKSYKPFFNKIIMAKETLEKTASSSISLGKFLQQEFGGKLTLDATYELPGMYEVEIANIPMQHTRQEIVNGVVRFYDSLGYSSHEVHGEPVFYRGERDRPKNVRCLALSDFRGKGSDDNLVMISFAPLFSTDEDHIDESKDNESCE